MIGGAINPAFGMRLLNIVQFLMKERAASIENGI
ncbi:hypothetical protein PFRI_05160 [Planktotalea frisia]|jgi:hypothetical protein|uniref:Uncharacterized protein n=1 Tax=Planktotalea frisia TaxID=696762 RepID=A0A1L9P164_9RHOB|nr:hypothetical protein PFRI_05160 [Planktotalea frisia]